MPWYRHLLWPFAIIYGIVVTVRNLLFDIGILPSKEFDVPVICVGNLETGGTGKSPLVSYIVRMLLQKGKKVAVISRGYGRKTTGFRIVETNSLAVDVGDEPLQLKRRHPEAIVAVCENRVRGIEHLLASNPKPDFVVMDDGFQHRWVKPSFSILVTAAHLPYIQNWLLPVGTLRETMFSASRADVCVITGVSDRMEAAAIDNVYLTKTVVEAEVQISGRTNKLELGGTIISFCGIANAERFQELVRMNFNVLEHFSFADHHNYTVSDLKKLREKIDSFGAAVDAVITTEKDAVRLMNTPLLSEFGEIPVYYLPIDIGFLFEKGPAFEILILQHGKHA
ncbi:MAG: tetraacyldisaccharide 4'-kinase [Flavobacteriales bacterium]|nr:tetraacyldisaccharide 4'-kinase [Flavobacteriales bacterium]